MQFSVRKKKPKNSKFKCCLCSFIFRSVLHCKPGFVSWPLVCQPSWVPLSLRICLQWHLNISRQGIVSEVLKDLESLQVWNLCLLGGLEGFFCLKRCWVLLIVRQLFQRGTFSTIWTSSSILRKKCCLWLVENGWIRVKVTVMFLLAI